jgi:sulfate/thiosulfate transport system permease protein
MRPDAPPAAPMRPHARDPWPVRWGLTLAAVSVLVVLVVVPVVHVFWQAFARGPAAYFHNLFDPLTRHAIFLTLIVAPSAVVANLVFGVAAAWAIARFRFPGRTVLLTLIDLPFSVSPVVAGLVFVLLFGLQGYFGGWLQAHGFKIIFATPGLILVTAFVTFPFVARELIPVLEAVGPDEEIAARSLGATGWQMFWRVTLPNVKWGVLYGVILCNARAMGEFGAVYVVSGHIAGRTDTMPLRVEKLFQEYNLPGAFALASVLTLLALVTLALKVVVEKRERAALREGQKAPAVSDKEAAGQALAPGLPSLSSAVRAGIVAHPN